MFVDTHAHIYDESLMNEAKVVMQRALEANVARIYMPNCDPTTIAPMMQLATDYPEHCFPMIGLHPCYVKENYQQELAQMERWLEDTRIVAVGEIGLDYYWDLSFKAQQIEAFNQQMDWALQYHLPIVIHSRESTQDCIDWVRKKQNGNLRGVFHCFSGTVEEAKAVVDLGFYLGIGGVVTYKKSNLPEIIAAIGLQHILLETDAPYLAPTPYRGKRNESSYIPIIAQKIAEVLTTDLIEVATITTKNATQLYQRG